MDLQQFLNNFAGQFDEVTAEELTLETRFRDFEEWASIIALSIMVMCAEEYNVFITAPEMESANTVGDIYNLVLSRTEA